VLVKVVTVSTTTPLLVVTVHTTCFHALPSDPEVPVGSTVMSSQGPIWDGIDKATIGETGFEGAATATVCSLEVGYLLHLIVSTTIKNNICKKTLWKY